jgi:hypothetical protein
MSLPLTQNTRATWSIGCTCICPECQVYMNVLDADLVSGPAKIEIGKGVNNVMIRCMECDYEFLIDIEGTNKQVRDIVVSIAPQTNS